jgi:MFS family permease/quinol monooxygenase YgiN
MAAERTDHAESADSAWAPFRHPLFRALWIAQFVSNIGTWMQSIGAVWVMVELHSSPAMIALVQTANSLPMVLVAIAGGALADLIDRRRLLLLTQTLMLLAAGTLALLTATGRTTQRSLLALTFALGIGTALNAPAWQAIQPELVPREEFAQAVTLGGASINLGRAIGPAIGGLIVAVWGAGLVFALNAVSFAAVVLVLWRWKREPGQVLGPPERFLGAVRAGLRYALYSRVLNGVLIRAGLFSLASSGLMALLPVYSTRVLGLDSGGLGGLLGGFGVGAVGAAAFLPSIRRRLGEDRMVVVGSFGVAASLLALAEVRSTALALLVMVIAGTAWLLCLSTFNVASQQALPGWVRARGLALYLTAFMAGIAVGSALWGELANIVGVPVTFGWGAAAVAATTALGLRWKFRRIAEVDLSPAPFLAPEMRLPDEDASGPVLVTVAYDVRPESEDAFQRALALVGRSRRRTGAVQWSVYRDAENPGRFIETYVVPSWEEHVRQHGRRTVTDASLTEGLRVFLREGTRPEVKHYVAPARQARRERLR